MIARVRAYSPDGGTLLGVLPTQGLQFSVERGGGGGISFTALTADLDSLACRDSLLRVELLTTPPSTWTAVAAYTLRPPFRREKVGKQRVQCTGVAVLEQWASETVILPEYSVGDIPRGAGTDRGIGWMSSAYDPTTDPNEAWSGCYETSRTAMPPEWPTGTGAKWISITGATDAAERKLFRAEITVTVESLVRVYFSSDETATLWVAGEPVLNWTDSESQGDRFETVDMVLQPGTYAVACDTMSIWDTDGGDGIDPILCAVATIVDAAPDTWLVASNETDWVACRRDEDPPDNDPPGPTPGAMLAYLVGEAQERVASGWAGVTLGFTATTDSQSAAWASAVIERQVRYGSDTYWSVLQMLAETNECDVWMTPALVLQAATAQGVDRTGTVTLDETSIASMSDQSSRDEGTWVAALAMDGWITAEQGSPRREYGMEVGSALSRAVAGRIVASSLAENGRWDGSCRLAPAAPVPLVAFGPGDSVTLDYADAPTAVQVLSISATAGEATLLWDLELVEVPA